MTLRPIRVLAIVGVLLISAQLSLAVDERREAVERWWSTWGEKMKAELAALPEQGRHAFRDALVACSLYADEYDSDPYRAECRRAVKFFVRRLDAAGGRWPI